MCVVQFIQTAMTVKRRNMEFTIACENEASAGVPALPAWRTAAVLEALKACCSPGERTINVAWAKPWWNPKRYGRMPTSTADAVTAFLAAEAAKVTLV